MGALLFWMAMGHPRLFSTGHKLKVPQPVDSKEVEQAGIQNSRAKPQKPGFK
jgi:hypothetical protein